jgi:hypothetical protein
MLSTPYRLRLSGICNKIATCQPVPLEDRIWAQKLGEANRTAASMLRCAHRSATNPDMIEGSMDAFLNALDIGGQPKRRFEGPDDIADWFRRDDTLDWRQRD